MVEVWKVRPLEQVSRSLRPTHELTNQKAPRKRAVQAAAELSHTGWCRYSAIYEEVLVAGELNVCVLRLFIGLLRRLCVRRK